MSKQKQSDPIIARLDALIRVGLEAQKERDETITVGDQILILQDAGLTRAEASKILGIPSNQVPSYLRSVSNKRLLAKFEKT
jgi:Fic family protein